MDPEFEKTYYGIPLVYLSIFERKAGRVPWPIIRKRIRLNRFDVREKILSYHKKRKIRIPRNIIEKVKKRDKFCVYCGYKENLGIDHIIPIKWGGSNAISNLVLSCNKCNSSKSALNIIRWCDKKKIAIPRAIFGLSNGDYNDVP